MIYKFVFTTDKLEEITVAKAELKRENSIITRLVKEANKLFGNDNWEPVSDNSNSLDNIIGWYACQIEGYKTLEVRAIFQ